MNPELQEIVREMVYANGKTRAEAIILDAHCGRPRQPINMNNQHLFRQYRNRVSADPKAMIEEAM